MADRLRFGWQSSALRREPRGGAESVQWLAISDLIRNFSFSERPDRLGWDLDATDEFSVSSARCLLDERSLFTGGSSTRWNNFVPIKLNILIWRISLARVPTRVNLGSRGMVMESTLCPMCVEAPETVQHVFAGCKEIDGIWPLIARWWDVVITSSCSVDSLIRWADNISFSAMRRKCFDAVIITAFWVLWNFRNANIFGTVKPKSSAIFDDIVGRSYFWICNRWKNCKLNWGVWLQNPAFACNMYLLASC